jgi:hypothetical protein
MAAVQFQDYYTWQALSLESLTLETLKKELNMRYAILRLTIKTLP